MARLRFQTIHGDLETSRSVTLFIDFDWPKFDDNVLMVWVSSNVQTTEYRQMFEKKTFWTFKCHTN